MKRKARALEAVQPLRELAEGGIVTVSTSDVHVRFFSWNPDFVSFIVIHRGSHWESLHVNKAQTP